MSIIHVPSVSGGKDSAVTLHLCVSRFGRRNVRPIFCDTGNEHPDTYEYIDYLEQFIGLPIHRLKADFSVEMEVHRRRLEGIAAGAPDYHPQAKYPWTPERAAMAAANMQPTGNAFLDLAKLKGCFPSHSRQFCTEELKRNLAVEFQLDLIDAGHTVVSWQGVRRDESARRVNVASLERIGPALFAYRPIASWSAKDVFDYHAEHSMQPNPLYLQGMNRVGCMPCVNCTKGELREIANRFPDQIDRIEEWEREVNKCSRSGLASFFYSGGHETIRQRVEWSRTSRGGKQYDLFAIIESEKVCASAYGLCE